MLGKKEIKFPVYSTNINKQIDFDKEQGLNWEQLQSKGFVKETIEENEDYVSITKEFVSADGTMKKKETLTVPKEEWDVLRVGMLSKEEAAKEIERLRKQLNEYSEAQEFEKCTILRDKILLIEKTLVV